MTIAAILTKLSSLRVYPHQPVSTCDRADDQADNDAVLELLNDALATELACMLRNRHHYFVSLGSYSQGIAQKFLDHADEALQHADRLAARIVQLGGTPDFAPEGLTAGSHAGYVEGHSLSGRLRENMMAKHRAIDGYRCLIRFLGRSDPATCCLLKDLLARQEQHGDELADQLVALHMRRRVTWPLPLAIAGHSLS